MSALILELLGGRVQFGCKGPRAAEWLAGQGLALPERANTYGAAPDQPLVARLGWSEFFVEQGATGHIVRRLAAALAASPAGVYPVLREDWAMRLHGAQAEDLLAQVCSVEFAALDPAAHPVIMTLMVGVAVLIVPVQSGAVRHYRIWCDPTYGPYLRDALRGVVVECGGTYSGVTT